MSLSNTATFSLERKMNELRFRRVRLAARERLAPNYVRLRFEGEDLIGFDSPGHDDHVRIFFPTGEPETVEEMREAPSREYTPLRWGDGWLEMEFLVHGDEGIAGPWADSAPLGSLAGIGGPRGSKVLSGSPSAWLLAGDETAIPAIRRYAAQIPDDTPATILVEVAGPAEEVPIDAPVEYVHRRERPAGVPLGERLNEIRAEDRPGGDVFAFVAAEQSVVKPARALLCDRWDLDPDRISVRGYWKRGDEEYHAPH